MADIVVLQNDTDNRIAMSPKVAEKLIDEGNNITIVNCKNSTLFSKVKNISLEKNIKDIKNIDILITTIIPEKEEVLSLIPKNTLIIALNLHISKPELLDSIKSKGLKFLALNKIPRITRAQSMDVLSSQSNLAGYRSVIEALYEYGKVCPMMMTAAGTIKPAKFLILGAGVAGLQAIATAHRLGGIVSAFDVRNAAKEQVESLGAKFISVELSENSETSSGYAKEMSEEYKKKQEEKLSEEVKNSDIIITTAQIPDKPAPKLITESMIKSMKPGSVILDMAVESGGNCAFSEINKIIKKHNIKIIGYPNLASRIAEDASELFAKNVFNLLKLIIKNGELKIDTEDEIIKSSLLVC